MQLVQGISRWHDGWARFEAIVGLVAVFVLAFGPLTVATFALIFSMCLGEWPIAAVAAVVTAVTCPMALWLVKMAESALEQFRSGPPARAGHNSWSATVASPEPQSPPPLAILLASELPPLPLIARVPLAIWWLAHFVAGTALVEFADVLTQAGLWDGFIDGVPGAVFGYLFHFAANVFLVLAVTVCFGSLAVTTGVWRRRFAIDAFFIFPLLLRMVI